MKVNFRETFMFKNLVARVALSVCLLGFAANAMGAAQYYGYYFIDGGPTNYLTEVTSQSNLAWTAKGYDPSTIASDLNQAASNGVKIVIDVSDVFFDGDHLRSDYASRWSTLATALSNTSNTSSIAAFYPHDEPGSSFSDSDLATAISTMKATFPSIPAAVIYAYDPNTNYRAIGSFDWVGIDCYSNGSWNCSGTNYSDAYRALRNAASSTAKFILVPQAAVTTSSPTCCVAPISAEGERLYELSLADSRVVAVVPFIWQDVSGTGYYGLRDSQSAGLQSRFSTIGTSIKNGATYPSGIVPVFRSFLNSPRDHFFSLSGLEGFNAGWDFEAVGFTVYNYAISGGVQLYRCLNGNHHFLSTASNCEGTTTESSLGYIMSYQVGGTIPLYRFFLNGDHLTTTSYSEGVNYGYTYESTLGYVPSTVVP